MTFAEAIAEQIDELRSNLALHGEHCEHGSGCTSSVQLKGAVLALACLAEAVLKCDELDGEMPDDEEYELGEVA